MFWSLGGKVYLVFSILLEVPWNKHWPVQQICQRIISPQNVPSLAQLCDTHSLWAEPVLSEQGKEDYLSMLSHPGNSAVWEYGQTSVTDLRCSVTLRWQGLCYPEDTTMDLQIFSVGLLSRSVLPGSYCFSHSILPPSNEILDWSQDVSHWASQSLYVRINRWRSDREGGHNQP